MNEKYPLALPQGTVLAGQYIIEDVLGQGGFGITYRALDHKSGSRVALKEFFPDSLAARTSATTVSAFAGPRGEDFAYGKQCFLQEAETLAQFIGNDNIVRVHSYFEENGTAYFVMDYIEGISLAEYIRHYGGKITYEQSLNALLPVIDALGAVHNQGIIHRDVTPDNIFITTEGVIKLIDFGAARYSLGDKSQSLDIVLKHGYAPKEQYMRRGRQGPYTDIYSLGACFYFAVTGTLPPDSVDRLEDDKIVPMSELGADLPDVAEQAIMKALSVRAEDRFRSMEEFKMALFGRAPAIVSEPPVKQTYFTAPGEDGKDKFKTVLMEDVPGMQGFTKRPNDHIRPKTPAKKKDKGILGAPLILYIAIALMSLVFAIAIIVISVFLFKADPEDDASEAVEAVSEEADEDSSDNGDDEDTGDKDAGDDTSGTSDGKGKARIGFYGSTVTDDLAEYKDTPRGVMVSDVIEGTGAEEAGMLPGDIITNIRGRTITSMETLKEEISGCEVGESVVMSVQRPGENGYEEEILVVVLTAEEGV